VDHIGPTGSLASLTLGRLQANLRGEGPPWPLGPPATSQGLGGAPARQGDVLVVWKLDRLSRSLKDLLRVMERVRTPALASEASPRRLIPQPLRAACSCRCLAASPKQLKVYQHLSLESVGVLGCGPERGDLKGFLWDFTYLCWANPNLLEFSVLCRQFLQSRRA
jgi:Resolvase, N terminal domain